MHTFTCYCILGLKQTSSLRLGNTLCTIPLLASTSSRFFISSMTSLLISFLCPTRLSTVLKDHPCRLSSCRKIPEARYLIQMQCRHRQGYAQSTQSEAPVHAGRPNMFIYVSHTSQGSIHSSFKRRVLLSYLCVAIHL